MLRIDPAHPPVWRTASVLQFGADPVALLEDPQPWQLRVVRELENGVPDGAFVTFAQALGAPDGTAATRFLSRIRPALVAPPTENRTVTLHAADEVSEAQRAAIRAGLAAVGLEISDAEPFAPLSAPHPATDAVVFVVHRVATPRSAAALMADDVPHLPVVLTGSGAEVGPFVLPGVSACLSCVAAHRRERDPHWPAVAAQLIGRAVDPDVAVTWEAGVVAGRLLSDGARRRETPRSRSVSLRAGSLHRSVRIHRPHADCRCRSLAGTVTADAPVLLETRSATAFARPA